MKKKIKLSKLLQIGLLLTFLLPFFPSGCKPKQAENFDPTAGIVDTLSENSSELTNQIVKSDTLKSTAFEDSTENFEKEEVTNEDKEVSVKISQKSSILKLFLRPNDNYTGIATIIDCFSLLELGYGLGLALILWIIGLIIKLKDYNNIFILINITGFVLLIFSHSMNVLNDNRLWGFWVCLFWSATMIIYDFFVLFKIKKEQSKTCA